MDISKPQVGDLIPMRIGQYMTKVRVTEVSDDGYSIRGIIEEIESDKSKKLREEYYHG